MSIARAYFAGFCRQLPPFAGFCQSFCTLVRDLFETCSGNRGVFPKKTRTSLGGDSLSCSEKTVQISTSDPDSRQLNTRNNITEVAYNVQATVDSKYNLAIDFKVANQNDSKAKS